MWDVESFTTASHNVTSIRPLKSLHAPELIKVGGDTVKTSGCIESSLRLTVAYFNLVIIWRFWIGDIEVLFILIFTRDGTGTHPYILNPHPPHVLFAPVKAICFQGHERIKTVIDRFQHRPPHFIRVSVFVEIGKCILKLSNSWLLLLGTLPSSSACSPSLLSSRHEHPLKHCMRTKIIHIIKNMCARQCRKRRKIQSCQDLPGQRDDTVRTTLTDVLLGFVGVNSCVETGHILGQEWIKIRDVERRRMLLSSLKF